MKAKQLPMPRPRLLFQKEAGDHIYPEEHKRDHWLRALERMKKDQKVIDDYFKRLVDKVRKEVD